MAGGDDNNPATSPATAAACVTSPVATRRAPQTANTHNAAPPAAAANTGLMERSLSTRRSLVRNSQRSRLNTEIGLTRSQSLRRHYQRPFRVDDTRLGCPQLAERYFGDELAKRHSSPAANSSSRTMQRASNPDTSIMPVENHGQPDGGGGSGALECAHLKNAAAEASSNNATTTTAGNATGAVRPNTLATPPAGAAKTGHSPKSPRTPNTPPQGVGKPSGHHSHHPHQHSSGKGGLASVPETKLSPKTPPVTPDSPSTYLEDDLDSMYSFATTTSGRSTMSCEHPYVARNGTTFSGRKMKYVVHCSNYAGQGSDYLTPTQRAQRQLRRLKELLYAARQDLEDKDSEIVRLTREVVELRLFKASLSSPEERSASSDAVTVREAELKTSQDVSPIDLVDEVGGAVTAAAKSSPRHIPSHNLMHHHHHASSEMQSSFADSGHFEDMTLSSVHSKDCADIACGSDEPDSGEADDGGAVGGAQVEQRIAAQRQELISMYEKRIEELLRIQDSDASEMKRSHNDRVEALLQKLAECNTRYADIVPDYEHAKERIRELEKQLEELQRKLAEYEEKQNKMYLHMYQQQEEAERIARADQALELAHRASTNKVSLNELLQQLQSTQDELENIRAAECRSLRGSNHALLTAKEAISLWVLGARKTIYRRLLEAQKNHTHVDPEVTLQFLKSAVYYFLTDKQNSDGHLQAIESILEFTEAEKKSIHKARTSK